MQKQLELSKEYSVVFDNYNFMLRKETGWERKEKDGKIRHIYKTMGYYSSFDSLLNGYVDCMIRDKVETSDSVLELIHEIKTLRESISETDFKVHIRDFLGIEFPNNENNLDAGVSDEN